MTFQKWAQKIVGMERERLGIAAVAVAILLGGGLAAFGGLLNKNDKPRNTANTFTVPAKTLPSPSRPAQTASPRPNAVPKKSGIIVYVTGAVKRPGVYTLPADARLYHAIRAAGGFKENAVKDALNLADRAQDGDQLAVPARQKAGTTRTVAGIATSHAEPLPPTGVIRKASLPVTVALPPVETADNDTPGVAVIATPPPPGRVLGIPQATSTETVADAVSTASAAASTTTPAKAKSNASPTAVKFKNPSDGVVHLNTATDAELQQLSRCGPAMSAKIIAYRTQIGKFTDIKQLMDVKGVGEKTFAKWQPFLAL